MTHNLIKLQIKFIKPLNFSFITVEKFMIYPAVRFLRSDTEVIRNKCHFTEYHMTLSRGRGFKNLLRLLCERIYYLIKPICVYIFKLPDEVFTHLERNFVFCWVLELHINRILTKNNPKRLSKLVGVIGYIFLGTDFLRAQ